MIHRVRVKGYKSLSDVSLTLQPLTIILGPNAVGKSNLFDALRLLSHIVRTRSLTDAFTEHRGDPLEAFTLEEGGLSGLLAKEEASFTVEADVELSPSTVEQVEKLLQHYRTNGESEKRSRRITERYLRYRITVAITPRTGVLRVTDERLEALTKRLAILSPTNTATTISFEEPENGVHPRRLKLLADLLSNASQHRQVIVNTHSPLLAEHLSFSYLVRCRKQGRATSFEPLDTTELFRSREISSALENDEQEGEMMRYVLEGDWG